MKKYILSALTLALAFFLQSCLKDKGYDRFEYGLKQGAVGGPAVSFPRGRASVSGDTSVVTASISPSTTSFTSTNAVTIALENSGPLSTPTVVTIAVTPALLSTTGANVLTPFPAGAVTVPTTVTIPAGQLSAAVPITFVNSSLLNLSTTYGIGLTITSASNGVVVVNTRNNVVVQYNLKNKYDGRYRMNGLHNRAPYDQFPYTNVLMDMYTSGPSSVKFYWVEAEEFGHPIGTGPGTLSWYGAAVQPQIIFDPVTDLITNINNVSIDPTAPPISLFSGPLSGVGRYDPVAKKIYAYFRYNANDLRAFRDTLTYEGPRP